MKRIISGVAASFIALLCGWLVAVLTSVVIATGEAIQLHAPLTDTLVGDAWIVAFSSPLFIAPVWLFFLLPLYLFASSSSRIWRWHVCAGIGAAAGMVVLTMWRASVPPIDEVVWSWYALAAVSAGTTCLVGSLIHEHFRVFHASI
ncbi:MAG: hypothetical protein ACREIF_02300 [Chthoniobacterales bacterium]